MRTTRALVLFGLLASCGGSKKPDAVTVSPAGSATPAVVTTTPVDPCGGAPNPCGHGGAGTIDPNAKPSGPLPYQTAEDLPPEVFPPDFKKVAVGQTVSFSVSAIDQNLDETRVMVSAMPKSATFDAITQTVTWTPTKADVPKADFTLQISQPTRGKTETKTWSFAVVRGKAIPMPQAPEQSAVIETLLMIRQPKRLEQVNKDWPFDKMLLEAARGFKWQFAEPVRAKLTGELDKAVLFESFLSSLAQIHQNPRLDPKSDKFDKVVFGDPAAWKIVTVRPRIDRTWTELRIVYRAVKAPEPTFAMFRIRPTVEYVPPIPRPPEERVHNNKTWLGMVTKHLFEGGGPNPKFMKDHAAHGKAVAALVNELMAYDLKDPAKPYARGFVIGIALEAQLGGGSTRNPDGSYKSGDAWAWSIMKPFPTEDGTSQRWVNPAIPGFWTDTKPSDDGKTWVGKCANKYTPGAPGYVKGYEVLCRKTLGFVDLPEIVNGKVSSSRIDSNHLFVEHKLHDMVQTMPLEDGRRDLGEENGMTCSQCHIRNFAMHDYGDAANTDPSKGAPKSRNKKIATLNFQIVPSGHWEEWTLEFLKHQECRGKQHIEQFLGPEFAKRLTCPLAPK
jgi:hypothetical protein